MKLTQAEIHWICNEYKLGQSVDEIHVNTGVSASQIRRALAEGGLITLSWYKTKEEYQMLEYLYFQGITNLSELKEAV